MDYVINKLKESRALLDEYGFENTENILNEWNYAKDFSVAECKILLSIKGAAFTSAYMSVCQDGPLDMLMYYDARPCTFNNLFNYEFLEPRKGYFVHEIWGELLKNKALQCKSQCDESDIYVTSAKYADEKISIITYYTNSENQPAKTLKMKIENDSAETKSFYILDGDKDMEKVGDIALRNGWLTFEIEPNTVVVIC